MKNAQRLLVLLVALTLPYAATAQEAKPTNLRPQWTKGQAAEYTYWSKTVRTEEVTIGTRTQNKTTIYISEGTVSWAVDEVNEDGSSVGTMQLKTIKVTMKVGTAEKIGDSEPAVMDSENPSGEQPLFDKLLAAMVNTPIKVKVKPDGSVESIEGLDDLVSAAGEEAEEADVIPDELDFKESASTLASLIAAPAKATPGQTWKAKNTWNHQSVIPKTDTLATWDTTHTFDSVGLIEGVPVATIKTASDIDLEVDFSKLPEGGPNFSMKVTDAGAKGMILFDLSRHETVARNNTMSYSADFTVTAPGGEFPPLTVKVEEKNRSQILRVSEK